ncbi:MAG: N-acetylneuraminate synthase family protein [Phycisphaeraceae bacterium]|nr:N-acetylneuraminate synthase family protein [Phycisphaeraceae bacterium]
MKIGPRQVGPGCPVYIIAEIGVNHDGLTDRALRLVDVAAEAGCDAVKLQLFRADLLMSRAARLAAYQQAAGERDPIGMLRRLELPVERMAPIVARAHELGIHAIVTVFSLELVAAAQTLAWDAYKTASPDIVHRPLLEALSATGRPLIVSTGAATAQEVQRAVGWLAPAAESGRLALLQCVSCYPTRPADAAIEAMGDLATMFDGPVGYSDHTAIVETGAKAVLLGATILEKHITLDRTLAGPDHAASLEPPALRRYVKEARRAERIVAENPQYRSKLNRVAAQGTKLVLPCEQDVRAVSRQSIVAVGDLPAGHTLTRADVTFKRPGTGVLPFRLTELVGRKTTRPVPADTLLSPDDLS